jgi:hypothetical protein
MFLPPAAATVPDWSMWTRDPFALRSSFASNGRTRGSARTLRSSALPALSLYTDQEVFARCRGQVRDGQFLPLWRITGEQRENVFNPVVLSRRGHVLLLFHPLNRLPGLRTGQRWVMPLIDPEAALRLERSREIRNVLALVTEAEPLLWDKKMQPVFLVTLSDAEGEVGRIWVRQTDFLVLRQEFTFSNDRYALERSTTETPR